MPTELQQSKKHPLDKLKEKLSRHVQMGYAKQEFDFFARSGSVEGMEIVIQRHMDNDSVKRKILKYVLRRKTLLHMCKRKYRGAIQYLFVLLDGMMDKDDESTTTLTSKAIAACADNNSGQPFAAFLIALKKLDATLIQVLFLHASSQQRNEMMAMTLNGIDFWPFKRLVSENQAQLLETLFQMDQSLATTLIPLPITHEGKSYPYGAFRLTNQPQMLQVLFAAVNDDETRMNMLQQDTGFGDYSVFIDACQSNNEELALAIYNL